MLGGLRAAIVADFLKSSGVRLLDQWDKNGMVEITSALRRLRFRIRASQPKYVNVRFLRLHRGLTPGGSC